MTMSIKETLEYAQYFLTPYHTLCLSANHGVGKSSIIKNEMRAVLAKKHGIAPEDFMVIDRRASQLDPSDLIGGTWNVGGQTFNAPPYWVPVADADQKWLSDRLTQAGREWVPFNTSKYGILFLDEVNRGTKLVQQALFELILDHSLHGIRLPDTWYVVAAINGNGDLYDTPRQDPAWTDRLVIIDFYPTTQEYLAHMENRVAMKKVHPSVLSYLYKYQDHIDPDDQLIENNAAKAEKGHSRRSWDRLGEAIMEGIRNQRDICVETQKNKESTLLQKVAAGHVGTSMGVSYAEYVRDEFGSLSAADILDDFTKITAQKLKGLGEKNQVAFAGLNNAIVAELKKRGKKLPQNVQENILKYLEVVPREIVTGFWVEWGRADDTCQEQAREWNSTPRRMSCLIKASTPEKGYQGWLDSMTKKYGDFDVASDTPLK